MRLLVLLFCLLCLPAHAENFGQWKQQFIQRAVTGGLPRDWVENAMRDVTLNNRVIELDRKQPEGHMTLEEYVGKTVNPQRIAKGRARLRDHGELLRTTERRYGVDRHILVALWGKESEFGSYTGGFDTLSALATLAYEGRRRDFFEQELYKSLLLLRSLGMQPSEMQGSWAGALGQCQFMPSTYRRYGVDGDGDGRVDLWHDLADIFASMSSYLKEIGWRSDLPWGQRVAIPAKFDKNLIGRDKKPRDLSFWKDQGVRLTAPLSLPNGAKLRLYQPDGPQGPAYLLTSNFDVLMRWNASGYFATAVGRLADHLASTR